MPFIDLGEDFESAKETPLAPESEYDLVLGEVEHNTDGGKNTLTVGLKFESEDYAPFRHFISLPIEPRDSQNDQANNRDIGSTRKFKMLMVKRFCYAFSIPFDANGFDTSDVPGSRARLGVSQSPADDQGRIFQNLRLPRLPDEVATKAA